MVGLNRVRHLRDGREAFPAMLAAIDSAQREILLERYWVGNDAVGVRFRDRLVARALAGVAVFVTYDGFGSLGLFRSFWAPLIRAGGCVLENGPVAPWRRHFRILRLPFRDHRKILVGDSEIAFCGGLNLAMQWLPREEGGANWRDDVIESHGPAALGLRALACEAWSRVRYYTRARRRGCCGHHASPPVPGAATTLVGHRDVLGRYPGLASAWSSCSPCLPRFPTEKGADPARHP